MRAIDLTSPMVVTTDEATDLAAAAKMMRDKGVGDLVITRGRDSKPIGIVTDRDIVVHAIGCGLDPASITVADLCTRKPATVGAEADLMDIATAMNEHGVRRVLVIRGLELVGIISMDDVIAAMSEMMNNLSAMLGRQLEYEREHLESIRLQDSAA